MKKATLEIVDGRSQSPQKEPAQNTVSPFPYPTKKKIRTELSRVVIPPAEAELKQQSDKPFPAYTFDDDDVELGDHDTLTRGPVQINVRECMEYITANADLNIIRNDPFVMKYWSYIKKLAMADEVVCLFDIFDDVFTPGSIDKSTWADEDYEPLLDGMWQDILPHAHHQQRCENYVQMTALISKQLAKEARRTWRVIAVSTLIRHFNLWAIKIRQKEETNQTKKDNTKWVEGWYRIKLFSIFVRDFMKDVQQARSLISDDRYKEIFLTEE